MSLTTLNTPQKTFLEAHLRGTNRSLTSVEADLTFGIKNLRARISEMKSAGLRIRKESVNGRTSYSISRRDEYGAQFKLYNNKVKN